MRVRSPREQQEAEAQEERFRAQGRPGRIPPSVDAAVEGTERVESGSQQALDAAVMEGRRPAGKPGRWGGRGLWAALIAVLLLVVLIGALGV